MAAGKVKIEKNLRHVRETIAAACERARRDVGGVTILAVTKQTGLDEIKAVVDLGITDLAESQVPQLVERVEAMGRRKSPAVPVRWHMVGHLQRNKVKYLLDLPQTPLIHSVDSLRLAEEINARAERDGRTIDVLMEVNCSNEPQKYGVAVGAAAHLGELLRTLRNLRLAGLMTMAQRADDPEQARPAFVRLRELFDDMRHEGIGGEHFRHLSMGMSQDYAVAVEEGATMVRIGSALFE